MIREQAIIEWRREAPWSADWMVEQDLIISRALVELFSSSELADRLAFRGGTSLYKLHLPPARYSEDIDLVQVLAEPIGDTLDHIRGALDPWLGTPQRKLKEGRVNLVYRRQGLSWDFEEALEIVLTELITKLPGDPWKGLSSDSPA